MRDYRAVVWTRLGGIPRPMGELFVSPREARLSYDPGYLESSLPGLGVLYPPTLFGERPLVFERRAPLDLHPPLNALIPPRDPRNLQRRLALNFLRQRGVQPEPGFDEDWAVLMVTGHGGVGHLDVFADHDAARTWYAHAEAPELADASERFGFSLRDYLTWFDDEAAAALPFIGPTPSVGGMIPKFLVSMPATGWDGRIGLPRRGDAPGLTDALLKVEQPAAYPGLLELEILALDLHRQAGFAVPRHWAGQLGDLHVLAIERFDRDQNGQPFPLESLYAVLAAGAADVTDNHSVAYERVGAAIDNPHIPIVKDRRRAREHLLRRLLLALLTGNGDLHLENLSLLTTDGTTGFSPIYDPTPMRAYSRHDLLAPMPFGDYGDGANLAEAVLNFTRTLGLTRRLLIETLEHYLDLLPEYRERIAGLERLPTANREHLIRVTEQVERRLAPLLGAR